ncbi:hypothetical protein PMAYCL1PPCAC_15695, partial [Pristionchus mayeri]
LMPTCSDQPSTSFHVQFAGQVDSKCSHNENLQVVTENGIRNRFIRKSSRLFNDKLDVHSNRIVITSSDGKEVLSAPLHSIASISCDRFPSDQSDESAGHIVGLTFGTARRDAMRMIVIVLYARNEADAQLLCNTMNDLWMKSYSDYINNFLPSKGEIEPAATRKRDYSVVSSDSFAIASSGGGTPAIPFEDTGAHVRNLMKVIGDCLPRKKRAAFIQIMRKLSGEEESILLAMLKMIELFGQHKDKVAEFECIVPQKDLERFYQILMMHNIKPVYNPINYKIQQVQNMPSLKESMQKLVL